MKNNLYKIIFISILNLTVSSLANASMTAKDIAKLMLDRDDGRSNYTQSQLMSCRFKLSKGRYKCITKPRVKKFEGVSKDVGQNNKDTKSLNLIIKPAAEKGMAFLQNDYDDESKDSEQWMYLPAMKKLKRIISETDDGAKTGSLFGSEISYEDIEKRHLNDYSYELLSEEKYQKQSVWVIKSVPTAEQAKKTSYSSTKSWVDKDKLLPLKIEMYDRQNKLKKVLLQQAIKKVAGVWVSKQMMMINYSNQRMSMLQINKMAMNVDIADGLLGTRALNDANYRDKTLTPLRNAAKK